MTSAYLRGEPITPAIALALERAVRQLDVFGIEPSLGLARGDHDD